MTMIWSDVTLGALSLVADPDEYGVRWRCPHKTIDGWWGRPAAVAETKQRPRGHGVWVGEAFLPARSVYLRGWCEADTRAQVQDALDRLSAAASLTGTVLTITDSGQTLTLPGRCLGEIAPRWVNHRLATWSVQLLAADPRKLGPELVASTALPSSSGGLTVPLTVPVVIDAAVVSGQVALHNPGNIDGPVILRIDGPSTPGPPLVAPRVTHANSGRSLIFASSLSLGQGEYLIVDMQRREVLAQGQASAARGGYVTERGWSAFQPGGNVWGFAAQSGSGLLTVITRPAWM